MTKDDLKLIQEHIDMQQYNHAWDKCQELIEAQEPVGEVRVRNSEWFGYIFAPHLKNVEAGDKLYTHPHQCQECENLKHDLEGYMDANKELINKEWQGLTDDEALKAYSNAAGKVIEAGTPYTNATIALATSRAIGQALKEKNHG